MNEYQLFCEYSLTKLDSYEDVLVYPPSHSSHCSFQISRFILTFASIKYRLATRSAFSF